MAEEKDYIVYTDGGCACNPGGRGGCAAVIIDVDTGKISEYSEGYVSSTNNRMEIRAVILALSKIPEEKRVEVYSDSQYVVNTAKGIFAKSKNCDLWEELDNIMANKDVQFFWVRGHHGNHYNERCDQLATEAMSEELREDIGYSFATTHNSASRGGVMAISINIPEDINIPWITADASQINCKFEIEFFTTIYHPTFRDYAKLKTGGIDLVSKLQLGYFQEHFPKEIFETIKKYFSNPKDVLAVFRWYYRGLPLKDAIRKRYVDLEIAKNAISGRNK